jgi:hypothetical protein
MLEPIFVVPKKYYLSLFHSNVDYVLNSTGIHKDLETAVFHFVVREMKHNIA